MGLFHRDPKYDNPISNPLTDWFWVVWGGVELRQKKRWHRRREFNRRWMRWWYDEDHPMRGVRALSIIALLFTILALAVSGRLVGAQLCLDGVGCVFTHEGGVSAARPEAAPRVLMP